MLNKLPAATNVFGINSVLKYYEHLNLKNKDFSFKTTETADVLKMLQAIEPSKAAGLGGIIGIFLKDETIILAEPIRDIFNLNVKLLK